MTNYGLPLRFKAVEISIGNEVSTSKLVLDLSDGQWLAVYGGDTIRFDEEWPIELQIYQSTGHHDANGEEVFFGDVLSDGKRMYEVIYHAGEVLMSVYQQENAPVYPVQYFKNATLIGNIHTPHDELQRRAQEVLNA